MKTDLEELQDAVENLAKEAASERRPFRAAVLTAAADAIECWRTGRDVPEERARPEGASVEAAKRGRPRKVKADAPPAPPAPPADPAAAGAGDAAAADMKAAEGAGT